jgi:glycosyltransferase involved in cell wall biosynthesis
VGSKSCVSRNSPGSSTSRLEPAHSFLSLQHSETHNGSGGHGGTNLPNQIKVVCIGPAQTVRGGISSVIEKIRDRFPHHVQFRTVATYSQYTGNEATERGSRLVQGMVFLQAFARILAAGVFSRDTIFHIHLAVKGSTLRKGLVCVALRVLRCRFVVHAHAAEDSLFHGWVPEPIRRLLLWGLRGANYFIVLTQFWGDYYVKALRLPPDRILRLPNPAALPVLIPDRSTREGLNLLFLGRIGKRKGAFETIQAFAALPDEIRKKSRLILAGDGETEAAHHLADDLRCSSETTVLRWVGREEANRLLMEADVFLLPSRGEGMSMALLEAMAWGLAVVTTSNGGADEFLTSDCNCILVKPGDIQEISAALCSLTRNPKLRLRLGTEARRTASQLSVESYIAKLTLLYEDIASDPRRSNRTQALFSAK